MSEHPKHCKQEIMDRIIDIRYMDIEEEQKLSFELLAWAKDMKDTYAEIFAHIYLADTYIGNNNSTEAINHLMTAKSLITPSFSYRELLLKLYLFLGLAHTRQSDEQLGAQYYMEALAQAHILKDVITESRVLNNIACAFQRYECYDEALRYFKEALAVLPENAEPKLLGNICSNLAQTHLSMNQLDEAKSYIEKGESILHNNKTNQKLHQLKCWCPYYAAKGDIAEALKWAEFALLHSDLFYSNIFAAFEYFSLLFQSMYDIGNQHYAELFLGHMEQVAEKGGLAQSWFLRKKQIAYNLKFGPKEHHAEAYRIFYAEHREYKRLSDMTIVNAMKVKVHLEDLLTQRDELKSQQETLEHLANIDEMTQIYNRRFFDLQLEKLSKTPVEGTCGIIMFDIDYFKEYNDSYGHLLGDEAIKTVASCLSDNSMDGILVCRFGGDEFVCICDNLSQTDIKAYIHKVQEDLHLRNVRHKHSKCSDRLTLSIGFSLQSCCGFAPNKSKTMVPYEVMKKADEALYTAKLSSRNSYCIK